MRAKKILCVIGYDISDNKLRSQVDKLLRQYGTRVNKSLFECMLTHSQYTLITDKLPKMINTKSDSIVIYRICLDCYTTSVYIPKKKSLYESVKIL